jgi:4-amino-4-deoxy-L-arabinose transferase-like glycosyltransferase
MGRILYRREVLLLAIALAWYLAQSLSVMNEAPPASTDGAVFADAAHNLLTTGRLATDLVMEMKDYSYWQPPGYYFALAVTFRLFGYGLWQLRLLSIIFGVLCILLVYLLSVKICASRVAALVAASLVAFDPLFVKWVRWDRMDSLCMFFVLLSSLWYLVAIEKGHPRYWFGAGLSGAIATLIHPHGMISIALITLHTTFVRRHFGKEFLFFVCPVLLLFGSWIVYVMQSPQEYILQLQYQVRRKLRFDTSSFVRAISEFRFYPAYLIVVVGSLASVRSYLKEQYRSRGSLIVFVVLAVACSYFAFKGQYYHTYLAPILAIGVSKAVVRVLGSGPVMKRVVAIMVMCFVLNGIAYSGAFAYLYKVKLKQEANHEVLVERIRQYIPAPSKIGHYGYPTLYWILYERLESERLREMYFLREDIHDKMFVDLDYLVFTQSSNPSVDDQLTQRDVAFAEGTLRQTGRHLRFVARVGANETNAYRAIIYAVESGQEWRETQEPVQELR